MEKLLQWSIANTQGDAQAKERAGNPDPNALAQLLGNVVDDVTLMRENLKNASNPELSLENREISLDNFEMLIENLDNANNIQNLKLWDPLLNLLNAKEPSIRSLVCSIIGTAVQNNPKSQKNFTSYDNSIKKLIQISLDKSEQTSVKIKALYALSNSCRNFEKGYELFEAENGWLIVSDLIFETGKNNLLNYKLQLRFLSLLSSLLSTAFNKKKENFIQNEKVIQILTKLATQNIEKISFIDNSLNIIGQLISHNYNFNDQEKSHIITLLENLDNVKNELSKEDYKLVQSLTV
ncbi:Hsp70 nucleotide exchange factor FES1 [Ascoidea rubescens DSM 1968]|uniref:Hsp70 nucleotide exchange factor FES1 n=1 Tax=Ascoidea rubescens DSM 1968 TaxID=1344418 RepID=A0A1D2VQG1_9ASCO|nr:Hsp70 nucleotide exchange factor FES1 [Ascoidea rubescens DSM 1968]ODV63841.1 Hsp70 nucleotide exchange factor FES1 [Ascoidea rubescens DSM 1968]